MRYYKCDKRYDIILVHDAIQFSFFYVRSTTYKICPKSFTNTIICYVHFWSTSGNICKGFQRLFFFFFGWNATKTTTPDRSWTMSSIIRYCDRNAYCPRIHWADIIYPHEERQHPERKKKKITKYGSDDDNVCIR